MFTYMKTNLHSEIFLILKYVFNDTAVHHNQSLFLLKKNKLREIEWKK